MGTEWQSPILSDIEIDSQGLVCTGSEVVHQREE
jgi:hypothetical protein